MNTTRWKIAQWFERKWWQNYLKKKTPQEYLSWKTDYWENFLKKINISKEDIQSPIIDIGCGPAGIFTIFREKETTALDPLLAQYQEDLSIFDKKEYPKTSFITQDFESANLTTKYNTIFCLNAINHFHDINSSMEKLNSIAKDKGKLILSIDAHNHLFFKYLFRVLPLDILHPHQYDLDEYIDMIKNKDFILLEKHCLKKEFFFDYWVLVVQKV